ncbi:MAG: hypothetical protein UY36_C0007G0013 [Parcubacteria group bacterium GW2011_GWA1_49_11]|nr:MAG: hypothetical protein UY36_C0007G0013 [Parcubacteria group bacterium GW2011_GWA1_49_11]
MPEGPFERGEVFTRWILDHGVSRRQHVDNYLPSIRCELNLSGLPVPLEWCDNPDSVSIATKASLEDSIG